MTTGTIWKGNVFRQPFSRNSEKQEDKKLGEVGLTVGNGQSMKSRSRKYTAVFAFSLLLIGLALSCVWWVRKEQRQYALNRQLIEALANRCDIKQALDLVREGADPNTQIRPMHTPSLSQLVHQLLHPSPLPVNDSSSAFLMACGAPRIDVSAQTVLDLRVELIDPISPETPHLIELVQVMFAHGANVNATPNRFAALYCAVNFGFPSNPNPSRNLIELLLEHGADPDHSEESFGHLFTPLSAAENMNRPDIVALLRKYSRRP